MGLAEVLTIIIQNRDLHGKWLNSLSYLEYRGVRKILRSLRTEDYDVTVLTHVFEEARHALFFKKLALKVGGSSFDNYRPENMISPENIKAYFYHLDRCGTSELKEGPLGLAQENIYELMTWVIEERALEVYREYEALLRKNNSDISIEPVLKDEINHLGKVKKTADKIGHRAEPLLALESGLFQDLWMGLEKELNLQGKDDK